MDAVQAARAATAAVGIPRPGRLSLGLPPLLGVGLTLALHQCVVKAKARTRRQGACTCRAFAAGRLGRSRVQHSNVSHEPARYYVDRGGDDVAFTEDDAGKGRASRSGAVVSGSAGRHRGKPADLARPRERRLSGPIHSRFPSPARWRPIRSSPDLAALRCDPHILGYVQTDFPSDHTSCRPTSTTCAKTSAYAF